MDLDRILAELEEERDRVSLAIALLEEVNSPRVARQTAPLSATKSKARRRGPTPAGRRRLSELMKKRWAERRKKRS